MNILQEIFTDYYEEIKYTLHPRSTEMRNIDKMIHCGDSSHGGAMYLKWNPHIHCLISEGGYSDDGFWRNIKHFNYNFLRNAFRTALLNEMELKIGLSFKKVKSACYSEHEHGFYVYAKPNKCDPSTVIKYIGRYLGRPVIATSRIDSYDGDSVTFHYNRHEDNKYVVETIPAIDFIKRLICHIPEKNFKMIRYGGLYARHREEDKRLYRAVSMQKKRLFLSFTQ